MTIVELHSIPESFVERVKNELGAEYDSTISKIGKRIQKLYMFDNSLLCVEFVDKQAHIIFLIGEHLSVFSEACIKCFRDSGFKEIIAHTKRKGMVKHMESVGAKHIGSYEIYSLEL